MKIGDKFYRVEQAGRHELFSYTITGMAERSDGAYYEVVCNSCKHGLEHCQVEVFDNCKGAKSYKPFGYVFSRMLNDDGDESYEVWHKCSPYFLNERDAWLYYYEHNIVDLNKTLGTHKESVARYEQYIAEAQAKLEEWRSKNDA